MNAEKMPCDHAPSSWRYRVSSHTDAEIDAAGGVASTDRAFCSVWVCGRPDCIDRGKRYVAYHALCTPVLNEGTRIRERS